MNAAHLAARTLAALGVEAVFTNPGTSELHLVDALAEVGPPPVLVAQELVATGAADAQGRLAGLGAALLHLGPGLANGLAFLHDARRAQSPILVLVGEHPRAHQALDPPLAMGTAGLAEAARLPLVAVEDPGLVPTQLALAAATARSQRTPVVVTLDSVALARSSSSRDFVELEPAQPAAPSDERIRHAATLLREASVLLLGARALGPRSRALARGIAERTGARILAETFPSVHAYGGTSGVVERLAYLPPLAREQLASARALVTIGTALPVAWFAHPDVDARLWPSPAPTYRVDEAGEDPEACLEALAHALGAREVEASPQRTRAPSASSSLDATAFAMTIASAVREGDVVIDEARTSAPLLYEELATAAPHDYLGHPGGAIGEGLSLALGAALLGRRVLAVVADGGFLYAPQALWTMARHGADVTVVVARNGGYRILEIEQQLAGLAPRPELTRLEQPAWDFVGLSRAMGAQARRVQTVGELRAALRPSGGLRVVVADLPS